MDEDGRTGGRGAAPTTNGDGHRCLNRGGLKSDWLRCRRVVRESLRRPAGHRLCIYSLSPSFPKLHDLSFLEKYPLRETSVSRSNAAAALSYVPTSQSVRRVYGFILIENRRRRRRCPRAAFPPCPTLECALTEERRERARKKTVTRGLPWPRQWAEGDGRILNFRA